MTPIITFAVLVRIPARDGPYLSLIVEVQLDSGRT